MQLHLIPFPSQGLPCNLFRVVGIMIYFQKPSQRKQTNPSPKTFVIKVRKQISVECPLILAIKSSICLLSLVSSANFIFLASFIFIFHSFICDFFFNEKQYFSKAIFVLKQLFLKSLKHIKFIPEKKIQPQTTFQCHCQNRNLCPQSHKTSCGLSFAISDRKLINL